MIVFSVQLGLIKARATAEVTATDGNVEVAIKRVDAAVPLAWLLRRKINEAIRDRSPILCKINDRANLEFTLPVKVLAVTVDLELGV